MGSQDGKRRRIHWAIAAPQVTPTFVNVVVVNDVVVVVNAVIVNVEVVDSVATAVVSDVVAFVFHQNVSKVSNIILSKKL